MPSNYSKGRSLEYYVKKKIQAINYVVFRCAGSRPVDLIAIKRGSILLIECKTGLNPYLSSIQLNHIIEISKITGSTPILAVRKKYRGIRWFRITEKNMKEIELNDFTLV